MNTLLAATETSAILLLLLQAGLILALSRVMGMLMGRIRQPQVIGEMIAGIMLGPSLLGLFFPAVSATLFPAESIASLGILSQIGVVFFLFLIGLEFDPKLVKNKGRAAFLISNASIALPFAMGIALTFWLYPRVFDEARMDFMPSALFMGAAISVTAFPVLARILTERNLHKTQVGALTITAAAVNDVVAWCMLALVVAIAQSQNASDAVWTAALSMAYVAVMFFAVKPFLIRLERLYERQGRLSQGVIAIIFLSILGSSLATEAIGIHAMFGAFLLGCIMPKGTQFVRHLTEKLEDFTVVFLLPIFFAYTGLRTDLTFLRDATMWNYTMLIVGVACVGKIFGAAGASRLGGIGWRPSLAIGVLMNTRGLMELVILNIGREMGVINDTVFGMMVIMALVTTAMTAPLLSMIYPKRLIEHATLSDEASSGAYSILIPISLPRSGKPLVQLADLISGSGAPRRISALYLRRPDIHEAVRSAINEPQPMDEALRPLLDEAHLHAIPVEPISFVTSNVADDIAATAVSTNANLILMGFHKPVIGSTILGGTVHRVLTQSDRNVAIFVDRGFREAKSILVPYMGGQHDRFALALANRMAKHSKAAVTVLHVVPPKQGTRPTLNAEAAVNRVFKEPDQASPVTFSVVEDDSPVDVVLQQAPKFDLVIVGVSEEWGLESQLFGWRPERIARDCPTSLLIVRQQTLSPSTENANSVKTVPLPQL